MVFSCINQPSRIFCCCSIQSFHHFKKIVTRHPWKNHPPNDWTSKISAVSSFRSFITHFLWDSFYETTKDTKNDLVGKIPLKRKKHANGPTSFHRLISTVTHLSQLQEQSPCGGSSFQTFELFITQVILSLNKTRKLNDAPPLATAPLVLTYCFFVAGCRCVVVSEFRLFQQKSTRYFHFYVFSPLLFSIVNKNKTHGTYFWIVQLKKIHLTMDNLLRLNSHNLRVLHMFFLLYPVPIRSMGLVYLFTYIYHKNQQFM